MNIKLKERSDIKTTCEIETELNCPDKNLSSDLPEEAPQFPFFASNEILIFYFVSSPRSPSLPFLNHLSFDPPIIPSASQIRATSLWATFSA